MQVVFAYHIDDGLQARTVGHPVIVGLRIEFQPVRFGYRTRSVMVGDIRCGRFGFRLPFWLWRCVVGPAALPVGLARLRFVRQPLLMRFRFLPVIELLAIRSGVYDACFDTL